MPEIALEPRPGDSLGPYRITRVIGRARMGIVFEGTADAEDPVKPTDYVAGVAGAAGL
jgi:hypothetical protein